MHLSTSSLADYVLVAKLVCSDEPTATIRLHLIRVKTFSKNISFSKNVIFWKGKYIQVFGCVGIRFTENQFRCLVLQTFYRKSISMFVSVKHFTENEIHFLRKINSHVWFVDHFPKNNNFKHLYYLNKPATVQKYSSKFKHLHCLDTFVTGQKYSSTSKIKNNHLNIPIIFK